MTAMLGGVTSESLRPRCAKSLEDLVASADRDLPLKCAAPLRPPSSRQPFRILPKNFKYRRKLVRDQEGSLRREAWLSMSAGDGSRDKSVHPGIRPRTNHICSAE